MKFLWWLLALGLVIEIAIALGLVFMALVMVGGMGLGVRAVWLEYIRRYELTHGRRHAGGFGGRRLH